jgi:hypothetical protein
MVTFAEIFRLLENLTDEQLNALDEEKFVKALIYIYHIQ